MSKSEVVPITKFRREMRRYLRLFELGDLDYVILTRRRQPILVACSMVEYARTNAANPAAPGKIV